MVGIAVQYVRAKSQNVRETESLPAINPSVPKDAQPRYFTRKSIAECTIPDDIHEGLGITYNVYLDVYDCSYFIIFLWFYLECYYKNNAKRDF